MEAATHADAVLLKSIVKSVPLPKHSEAMYSRCECCGSRILSTRLASVCVCVFAIEAVADVLQGDLHRHWSVADLENFLCIELCACDVWGQDQHLKNERETDACQKERTLSSIDGSARMRARSVAGEICNARIPTPIS